MLLRVTPGSQARDLPTIIGLSDIDLYLVFVLATEFSKIASELSVAPQTLLSSPQTILAPLNPPKSLAAYPKSVLAPFRGSIALLPALSTPKSTHDFQ